VFALKLYYLVVLKKGYFTFTYCNNKLFNSTIYLIQIVSINSFVLVVGDYFTGQKQTVTGRSPMCGWFPYPGVSVWLQEYPGLDPFLDCIIPLKAAAVMFGFFFSWK